MRKFYNFFLFSLLLSFVACESPEEPITTPDDNTPVVASFTATVDGTYRVLYNADSSLNEINSGTIVNFESTSTGSPADEDIKWALTWVDVDSNKVVTKEIHAKNGAAFMRFVEPGAYNITMTAEDSELTFLSYINVLKVEIEEPETGTDPEVDPNLPATVTDTFLEAAGWDTSFEDVANGFWKNFGWGGVYNMNTISVSTAKAKSGSQSTYFQLQSNGGMAGGYRAADGTQLTLPIESGKTYSIGFWIYIETMPENPNLCVVFGGNMSGYIPVTNLATTELNKWVYLTTNVAATGSNTLDLLLFSTLEQSGEGEFNFYIDDIAMAEYIPTTNPDGGSTGGGSTEGGSTGGEGGGTTTEPAETGDTYLAAAGWDTSFEDTTLGGWMNFNWGNALNKNAISNSTSKAKTGTHSTYFVLESFGGMAGGFRGPGKAQITLPVVSGKSYVVSFWIYIEAMPDTANLSVVFGGNKSGYIPVDLQSAKLGEWSQMSVTVDATGSDITDLLLFSDLSNGVAGEGEFVFYVDDIAMCDAK